MELVSGRPPGDVLAGIYTHLGQPDIPDPRPGSRGRRHECEVLDQLVASAREGRSAVLVVRGEAGIGKTALLEFLVDGAADCRIARATGVESEMQLAFAGLHQLCAPMLDHLDRLPGPQRDALGTAFGLSAGDAPDRFLVGLAVLSLLADVAEEQPLVCLVDDAQWLDQASAQALAFVARRLLAEPVALVFAARASGQDQRLRGLPELPVRGLDDTHAHALLEAVLRGPLDEAVRDRIVAESRGNPLALLKLPRTLTPAELAGGFGLPGVMPLASLIEQGFLRRLEPLPVQARQLLLTAAAEPTGDVTLLVRAAERLGIGPDAAVAAETAGLIEVDSRIRFRHPLIRSAAYRLATVQDRRDVHAALAEVTDPELDPDRRAWHRAHAAAGPDETVAAELERSAGRAQARGGLAAAAAFLARAAALTPEPSRRAARALAAAQAAFDLVLPSLPGYGFSGEPTEVGWDPGRIARAWAELMHRLGYTRYVAQGGDVGSAVTDAMGRQGPDGLLGIHLNLLLAVLTGSPTPAESEQERAALNGLVTFSTSGNGYFIEQATRPQTIGYALLDSPVALAAWMIDHDTDSYQKISRAFLDKQPAGHLTRDRILDNITLYWLTGTGASAAREYWETGQALAAGQAPPEVSIPVGFTTFPGEIWPAPRSWVQEVYPSLTYFNEVDRGGHFAAWEEPELFATEIRAAFKSQR